jgi:hypothetical protein
MTKRHLRAALPGLVGVLLTAGAVSASAQEATTPDAELSQQDELARQATDPTASPMNFAFINVFRTDYSDLPDGTPVGGTGYDLKFQPVLPFRAWGVNNILRMTVPFHVSGPGPTGLDDVTIFDLLIFPQAWGRLGVGAVGSFSARTSDVPSHASGGPAIGFVKVISKNLNLGLFNQNLFGEGVAVSQLQPIAAYQLGTGWSLSLGDLQYLYDWKRGEWLSLPVGVQLGKVLPIAGQPMRFAVNPQYDFKKAPGAPRFSVSVTVQLLLPQKKG